MKKLLLLLLIPIASCDRVFMDKPFVVEATIEVNEGCIYRSSSHEILIKYRCGAYNVGDTIKLNR